MLFFSQISLPNTYMKCNFVFKIQGTDSLPTAHLVATNQGGRTTTQLREKCCNHCEGKEVRKNTSCFTIQRKKKTIPQLGNKQSNFANG